ncbi:MAG TPA: class I SAM-dependent methyltransferase [Frankiaceae bacterium]|nr:class I SAM-dependent methyltransferase [Frankiaceae bacterium]
MTHTHVPTRRANPLHAGYEIVTALSMTVGRGAAARTVAVVAAVGTDDRVVDIGCGPATAAREAARRGATVTGVDPAPAMLRLARWITVVRRIGGLTWVQASAESLPLPAADATVVWALSSVHHWVDRAAALGEVHRVLRPGGRVVLAERLVGPGARGHAAHGLTHGQADHLARELQELGFADVRVETRRAARRTLVVVHGRRLAGGAG